MRVLRVGSSVSKAFLMLVKRQIFRSWLSFGLNLISDQKQTDKHRQNTNYSPKLNNEYKKILWYATCLVQASNTTIKVIYQKIKQNMPEYEKFSIIPQTFFPRIEKKKNWHKLISSAHQSNSFFPRSLEYWHVGKAKNSRKQQLIQQFSHLGQV